MEAVIFDTETTGLVNPVIVETAMRFVGLDMSNGIPSGERAQIARWNPGKPIDFGAMAVHGITDEDVANCLPASEFSLLSEIKYLIGHKIDFDWMAVNRPPIKRIDTEAMARVAWPELSEYKQLALLYFLDKSLAKQLHRQAHSAVVDVEICFHILKALLSHEMLFPVYPTSWEQVWQVSEEARLPKILTFGKYKGTRIENLPIDYVLWFKRQPEIDPYLLKAFKIAFPNLWS